MTPHLGKYTVMAIMIIAGAVMVCFSFGVGVLVGFEKAEFSYQWAENYHQNFAGPSKGFFNNMMSPSAEFTAPDCGYGKVINVSNNTLTINDRNNTEKKFIVDANTSIIYQKKLLTLSQLAPDDVVVIIGKAQSNGDIKATLIRCFPPCDQPTNP